VSDAVVETGAVTMSSSKFLGCGTVAAGLAGIMGMAADGLGIGAGVGGVMSSSVVIVSSAGGCETPVTGWF
jgi:hypothetical protein